MRTLDTHEQKSPRILYDAIKGLEQGHLEVGDYLSVEYEQIPVMKCGYKNEDQPFTMSLNCAKCDGVSNQVCVGRLEVPEYEEIDHYKNGKILNGNLVELKLGHDFGIHTEPLERFQDELYRMRLWQQKNPHVDLHAVWMPNSFKIEMPIDQYPSSSNIFEKLRKKFNKLVKHFRETCYNFIHLRKQSKLFYHYCQKYYVWGHIVDNEEELIEFLKDLDQPKSYQRDTVYMKRTKEPTTLARMFRQFKGISSEMAMKLSDEFRSVEDVWGIEFHNDITGCKRMTWQIREHVINDVIGYKKDGDPKKLALDLIQFLEDGE